MEIDKTNKQKTYFVIAMFIMIILLSSYVVIDKIIKKNEEAIELNKLNKTTNSILEKSSITTELSLSNKLIYDLYSYIDDIDIEYMLYLSKNKELSWDIKSLIVTKNLFDSNTEGLEILNIDSDKFEKLYSKIFEDDINSLSVEDRTASICGAASYDLENDIYVVNFNCDLDNNIKTFYKNVTFIDDQILINKYYIFIQKYINNGIEEYSLYKTNKMDEDNLLVANIKYEEISDYISDMNIISFTYSKAKDGKYYLVGIK